MSSADPAWVLGLAEDEHADHPGPRHAAAVDDPWASVPAAPPIASAVAPTPHPQAGMLAACVAAAFATVAYAQMCRAEHLQPAPTGATRRNLPAGRIDMVHAQAVLDQLAGL